jgi:hypothetical protein
LEDTFEGVFLAGVASVDVFNFVFGFLTSSTISASSSLFFLVDLTLFLALFSFSSSIDF